MDCGDGGFSSALCLSFIVHLGKFSESKQPASKLNSTYCK